MTEQLTANEKAYDFGYNDSMKGNYKISYEDWCSQEYEGSHSSYKAGFEDAESDNEADYFESDEE